MMKLRTQIQALSSSSIRKRSHTSDSIINAVIGACEELEETHHPQDGSRTLHSTPAKSGGKENDSYSKSSTLNRPKSGEYRVTYIHITVRCYDNVSREIWTGSRLWRSAAAERIEQQLYRALIGRV